MLCEEAPRLLFMTKLQHPLPALHCIRCAAAAAPNAAAAAAAFLNAASLRKFLTDTKMQL